MQALSPVQRFMNSTRHMAVWSRVSLSHLQKFDEEEENLQFKFDASLPDGQNIQRCGRKRKLTQLVADSQWEKTCIAQNLLSLQLF